MVVVVAAAAAVHPWRGAGGAVVPVPEILDVIEVVVAAAAEGEVALANSAMRDYETTVAADPPTAPDRERTVTAAGSVRALLASDPLSPSSSSSDLPLPVERLFRPLEEAEAAGEEALLPLAASCPAVPVLDPPR